MLRCVPQGNVSPMLFLEEKKKFSPPSYTEAITLPQVQPPARGHDREEELKPKLCKMIKTTGGYGFHLNGVQGVYGQHIKEVRLPTIYILRLLAFNFQTVHNELGCFRW